MTDLLEAVDLVTKPVVSKILREDGTLHTVRLPSLLEQIEEAVTSCIGSGGGGGTTTGNVLNSAALYEVMKIRAAIDSWRHMVGLRRIPDLVQGLRDWGEVFTRTGKEGEFYIDQIRSWAHLIKDTLDPPKRVPLVGPCVMCGASTYPNAEGEEVGNPVILEYPHELGHLDEAKAYCRHPDCGAAWVGEMSIRGLRYDMDATPA